MTIVPDDKDWTWVTQRPCPDCGVDASALAATDVAGLLRACAERFATLLETGEDAALRARPDPATWSPLEYACHVRDVFRTFDHRLARMLGEDDPLFANWDQDATAVEQDYAAQDPFQVARDLESAAIAFAEAYDAIEDTQWSRTGMRSDGARFTIESFGRYVLHDPMHHVWDVEQGYDALEGRPA